MGTATFVRSHVIDDTVIERIVRDLVRVKNTGRGAVITTPVLFPSGAHVTVSVTINGDNCFITDDGAAFAEADMMGAPDIFKRAARGVADESGIRFNSFEFFEANTRAEKAAGMIAIVADAAKRAVQITSERLAKRVELDTKALVIDRLREVFGRDAVTPDADISGASTHAWKIDALVKDSTRLIAVESVTPSPVSVSSAYVKLDDIRRIEGAPMTVAALRKKDVFRADQILILSRTAKILDASVGRPAFARLAS